MIPPHLRYFMSFFFFFLIPLYWRWDFSWSLHQCGQETISAEQSYWANFSFSTVFRFYCLLTLYTLTSVCIFSILFPIHFLRYWQGEFVKKSRASLDSVAWHKIVNACHKLICNRLFLAFGIRCQQNFWINKNVPLNSILRPKANKRYDGDNLLYPMAASGKLTGTEQ